ncbi:MAG: carbamoyl-phosphate synthase large subunit [Candidatus Limnocylindrales bacterium]
MTGRPRSILIFGSGPVVIGQAAEFDYAGTQACRALREEGIRTILLNSNPATIMTDPGVADAIYLEPLTVASVERILELERPDGILPGIGGQTGLNLAMEVARAGVLERTGTRLLGTPIEAIEMAEDRERFRDLLDRIGQPYAPSFIVEGRTEAERASVIERAYEAIGVPAIVRPAFTLGGTGGGIVTTKASFVERCRTGLRLSPIGQVMAERYLTGWQEIEYEVMRDAADTCIAVCSMENVDPLGVHTGDSAVVAPVQTLPDPVHQRLRTAALDIIRALGVEGGCNVQFALSPDSSEYAVIEVNPRVSRSSALASKATGYPIARVAAQIAVGRRLDEIPNAITGNTVAAFEPALDYVVVKLPRFPFDKFPGADRSLGSQMKATGEVMAIERTFGAALNKALRGLEQAGAGFLAEDPAWWPTLDVLAGWAAGVRGGAHPPIPAQRLSHEEAFADVLMDDDGLVTDGGEVAVPASRQALLARFLHPSDSRLWRLLALLRRGVPAADLQRVTGMAPWFLSEMARLSGLEHRMRAEGPRLTDETLVLAKRACFSDHDIGAISGIPAEAITTRRHDLGLRPGFAMVDTCAAEFAAETPYFYATYAATGSEPEASPVERPAALVIGSGPVRIGQGIEFDYCAVQAATTLRDDGGSAVMINSNPETVSTDFDASSRLYFEPLDEESVMEVIDAETPAGEERLSALIQFGGQTPLNLAVALERRGVPTPGISVEAIDRTEERTRFAGMIEALGIPQPRGGVATSLEEALAVAEEVGYPVLVRPSFVIGGLAIDFCYGPEDLARQLALATVITEDRPVRIDAFLEGLEVDVDALTDGTDVLIPGLLEHVERAGVHSGDSTAFFPPQRLTRADQGLIVEAMRRICLEVGVRGLVNAQFIVRDDGVYILEVNPRASRTVPFLSKVTGVPMIALATRIGQGASLRQLGWGDGLLPEPRFVAVKAPVFSTAKLRGVDPSLGPGMQSTGEVIGIHEDARVALAKALLSAALHPPLPGPAGAEALISVAPRDVERLGELAAALAAAGYRFTATPGTAAALRTLGHAVREVAMAGDHESELPNIVDVIAEGAVSLIVNTPMPRSGAVLDAAAVRHAAIAEGVLCMTTMDTAIAAAHALEPAAQARIGDVRSLEAWLRHGRRLD